jgi:hypothetical protein
VHAPVDRRRLTRLALGTALALSTAAHGGSLGFEWNPSPGASGYRLRFGTDPQHLDRQMVVHGATRVVLPGLTDCTRWYATVAAFNGAGESAPSTVIASWPRPIVTRVVPDRWMQGDQLALRVVGTNFEPGSVVDIDSSGVELDVRAAGCATLDVDVAAEPAAPGRRPASSGVSTLSVATPAGLSAGGRVEVLVDPSRFDVNRSVPSTDGRIDGGDAVWVGRRFGGREGDGTYDPDFDFSGDGWIDGEELAFIGSTLGRCWSGAAWTYAACPSEAGDAP